jgi:uncharacterized protein (DUF736 family)
MSDYPYEIIGNSWKKLTSDNHNYLSSNLRVTPERWAELGKNIVDTPKGEMVELVFFQFKSKTKKTENHPDYTVSVKK